MTLRTRLVLALVALTTIGLAVFGVASYTLYRRSLENGLDNELRAVAEPIGTRLVIESGGRHFGDGGPTGGPEPTRGSLGFDDYAALITADGEVLASIDPAVSEDRPSLPAGVGEADEVRLLTVRAEEGAGRWRILVQPVDVVSGSPTAARATVLVVASPTGDIDARMSRLLRIELVTASVLLVGLGAGAWLILRRGLRPLERISRSAASITAGDLSRRVDAPDDGSEVAHVGRAVNGMLDRLEVAFAEREATEQRLRQFLADASHELRTPLTTIGGYAELFRVTEDRDQLDLPLFLRRIEQESDRMRALVEELLLLARLDEHAPVATDPVDLAVVAADACSDAAAIDPTRRVTLEAPDPVVVAGTDDQLRQAVGNLVTNALRHTPEGTPIDVSVAAADGRAVLAVRDHGPGLDDAALHHAFDRFWRADGSRVGTGTGLGLSIVAGIAAAHGGRATAANADGGGARFVLDLPLPAPE